MGNWSEPSHVENYRFVAATEQRSTWRIIIKTSVSIQYHHTDFRTDYTGFDVTNKGMGRYDTYDR